MSGALVADTATAKQQGSETVNGMDVDFTVRAYASSSKLVPETVTEEGSASFATLTDAGLEVRAEVATPADDAASAVVATSSVEVVSAAGSDGQRPRSPTRCLNVMTFTLLSSACLLCQIFVFSVQVSTVTTVQKAFGLTSLDIGAWFSAYTAAEIVSGVLVTYFAGQSRTPRVLAAAMAVCGAACFAHALPHFVLSVRGGGEQSSRSSGGASGPELHSSATDVCGWGGGGLGVSGPNGSLSPSSHEDDEVSCSSEGSVTRTATALYIVAGVIFGLGYSPIPILPLVYIDDSAATKEQTSFYQGIFYGVNYFGYVIGYIFAAGTLTFYVDFSDVNFSNDDPRWIGAWWSGYIICGCVSFLLAVPMFFFPPRLAKPVVSSTSAVELQASKEKPDRTMRETEVGPATTSGSSGVGEGADKVSADDDDEEDYSDDLPSPKMFFPTLWRLLKNPIYVLTMVTLSMLSWVEAGFHAYLPKYLETVYHQTAAAADLETGAVISVVSTFTLLSGGWVVSRFKLGMSQCVALIGCTFGLAAVLYVVGGLISCPQFVADSDYKYNASYNCTGQEYSPTCINGISYYSPCHAGCYNVTVNVDGSTEYGGCFCSLNATVNAHSGPCRGECNQVFAYVAVVTLAYALPCLSTLAGLKVLLRCVSKDQKSFSLGIFYEILSLAAWLPSPIVYGKFIDGTCLVWGREADGCLSDADDDSQGNCLQHDNDDLRFVMHCMATSMQSLGCVMAVCTWFVVRWRERKDKESGGVDPTAATTASPVACDNRAFSADYQENAVSSGVAKITPSSPRSQSARNSAAEVSHHDSGVLTRL